MLLRLGLLLLSAAVGVACSGHRSERVKGACITDVECGHSERCEAETCIELGSVVAIGKVVGAPTDAQITPEAATAGLDACQQRGADGLMCTLEPGGNVVLLAPEIPGHRFLGWSGPPACASDTRTLTLARLAASTECAARYVRRLKVRGVIEDDAAAAITARSETPSAVCGGEGCEVDADAATVLTAPVRPGQQLIAFDGPGCGARSGYRVTVQPRDADVLCTARYGEALVVRGEARGAEAPIIATSTAEGAHCQGARCEIGSGDGAQLRAPELAGHRFRGWSGHPQCSGAGQVALLADVRESVVCTGDYIPRFRVTGASEGAVASIGSSSADGFASCADAACEVDRGDTVTLIAPSVPGARLRGWTGEGCTPAGGASAIAAAVARPIRCIAQYEPGVSVSGTLINADGEVAASSTDVRALCARGSCTIGLGETVTLVAPALERRTFMGWSGDAGCTGTDRTLVLRSVTTSKVCRATFVPRFQIAGRALPPQGGSALASSGAPNARCEGGRCEVDQGASVVLTANAGPSHRFTGWTGGPGCMGSQPRLELRDVRASLGCDAGFAARVQVGGVAAPADGGRVAASSSSAAALCSDETCTVDGGAVVVLRATPSPGFRFAGWSGCPEAPAAMALVPTLTLASATGTRCTGSFARLPVTVSASVTGGGGGVSVTSGQPGATCSSASCTFLSGGAATVSARPDPGHVVASFSCAPGAPTSATLPNVVQSQHCEVRFRRLAYSIRAIAQGGGTIEAIHAGVRCPGDVCSVLHGDGLTLRVTTGDEELLQGITGCAASALVAVAPGVYTARLSGISTAQTCTAVVIDRASVGFSAAPGGCGSVRAAVAPASSTSTCVGARCLLGPGADVTLTPVPAPSCRFVRWDCRGSAAPTFAGSTAQLGGLGPTSDVSCTAIFETIVI